MLYCTIELQEVCFLILFLLTVWTLLLTASQSALELMFADQCLYVNKSLN